MTPSRQRRTIIRPTVGVRLGVLGIFAMVLPGCGNSWMTSPEGPRAEEAAFLGWVMIVISAVVFAIVLVAMLWAIVRPRQSDGDRTIIGNYRLIVAGGIVIPAIVLVPLMVLTVQSMAVLEEPDEEPNLMVEVIAAQWVWQFRYPEQGITSAYELHIPAGEPVRLVLISEDVIHSFWPPQIMGKQDVVPGANNTIWIEAEEPGTYRGHCAEYCGLYHAIMDFRVVVHPEGEFTNWVTAMQTQANQR